MVSYMLGLVACGVVSLKGLIRLILPYLKTVPELAAAVLPVFAIYADVFILHSSDMSFTVGFASH